METRDYKGTVEVRANPETGRPMIAGYGIVFNSDSENLGGFIEQVDPGAVTKTLGEADIRGIANHNSDWTLGRVKAGTMRLRPDARGVYYEIDVNADDPDGQRALAKVQRGDWDGSSFCFETVQEQWDWDATPARRRLLEIKLIEMGPVAFPAYPDSTSTARAALAKIAKKVGQPVERMVEALRSGEIRSLVDRNQEDAVKTWEAIALADEEERAEERAAWSTAYINDLPDSAFLYIEDGGEKDDEGKTKPRSLRHFPYRDASGNVDLPHLRNALARIPDSDLPADVKERVTAKAKQILADHGGEQNAAEPDGETRVGRKLSAMSREAIQAAIDSLQALMAQSDTEPDADEDPLARALEVLAEARDEAPEPQQVSPVSIAEARARVRLRELEQLQQRHAA
jgi:HK97 family phage prohead protease